MRYLLSTVLQQDQHANKLRLSITNYNMFIDNTIVAESLNLKLSYKLFTFEEKITHCTWSLDRRFISVSKEGLWMIESKEKNCRLEILPGSKFFSVYYLHVLPKKTLSKNVAKLLEKSKKTNKSVGAYEYLEIKKLFKINDFPKRWALPLCVLLINLGVSLENKNDFFDSIFEILEEKVSSSGSNLYFINTKRNSELFQKIYSFHIIDKTVAKSDLPIDFSKENELKLSKETIWQEDSTSPSFNILNHNSKVFAYSTERF